MTWLVFISQLYFEIVSLYFEKSVTVFVIFPNMELQSALDWVVDVLWPVSSHIFKIIIFVFCIVRLTDQSMDYGQLPVFIPN